MVDRILWTLIAGALATMATISVRGGAILLGLAFLGAALGRRTGRVGELFTSRRERTDIAVLTVFAVALFTLAAVLPRR